MKIIKESACVVFLLSALATVVACTVPAQSGDNKATLPLAPIAADAQSLLIYSSRPLESWHITIADFESQQVMTGNSVTLPKSAKVPNSVVTANSSTKATADDALTLRFKDSWYANLHVAGGKPVDLRPYLAQGVLALDVNVVDMAQGGLAFKINCGKSCERKVPYLLPAREMAGKGWQHLEFSMRCFAHDDDDFSAVTQPFALDASGTGEVAVANVTFKITGTPNTLCPDYKTVSVTPDMLNESWSINWWLPRHLQKLEEVKNNKNAQVIFIGDSITQGWEKDGFNVWNHHYAKYNAVALGFGGDRTENILWRIQHGEVDGLNPKVAVLMLGTNNTGHRMEDPKTTALGIKRNIDELQQRLPKTKILLLAIFPRDENSDGEMRKINNSVNHLIADFADNKKVFFVDINAQFLGANGVLSKTIMPDLLHPNELGYEIWAKAMAPTLQKLLKR